jgi:hypothetical protein
LTAIENHEANVEHSNRKLTYGKDAIQYRRAMVLALDSKGYTYREIVSKLQIAKGTVSNDIAYLRRQAQQNLHNHIHEVIPYEYHKTMTGMKLNLKETLEIAETAADSKTKLQARAIANDCYKYIMDLTTNGTIVSDALKYVNGKTEKLDQQQQVKAEEEKEGEQELEQEGVF